MTDRLGNQYTPEIVSPPGETLAEILDDRGMSQAELAERMGRPKKTISEIIGAKAELTSETALQLERVLGVPASFWSNLERNYRDSLARMQEMEQLAEHADWPKAFPLRDMERAGWLARHSGPAGMVRSLLSFFGVSSIEQWKVRYQEEVVAYRRPAKFEPDIYALTAWLRAGERAAETIECQPYDAELFRRTLREIRSLTCETDPKVFVPRLQECTSACGVAVAFVPEVGKSRASGATRWIGSYKALIQLSLRYKSNDHLWFTFFHEAGHVLLHGKREVFIEFGKEQAGRREREKEADRFASDTLIPKSAYARLTAIQPLSEQAVRGFAEEIGVAPGIVVGRLQHDGLLPFTHLNGLKTRYTWTTGED